MLEENTPSSIHHVLEMNETDVITREFPFSRYETDKNQQLKNPNTTSTAACVHTAKK